MRIKPFERTQAGWPRNVPCVDEADCEDAVEAQTRNTNQNRGIMPHGTPSRRGAVSSKAVVSIPGVYHIRVMFLRCLCLFWAGLLMAPPAADQSGIAKNAFDLLLGAKYTELHQMFTPEMQKSIPEPALAKLGEQVKSLGAVSKVDAPAIQKSGPNTIAVFPAHFEKQSINFRFIINQAGKVAGMFMLPGEVSWTRPAYSRPDSFREREVTVGEGEWKLPGTLSVPTGSGPFPGVVMVHGLGPNDRDETVGGSKVFKDLAEGFASRGITVLRYEKRTRQYGPKMAAMQHLTIDEETVDDAVIALQLLRAQKEVDPKRTYLLGHDLGGYIAPRIATEDGKLAGIIIMAGNARPLEDLAVEQAAYLGMPAKQIENLKAEAARVKALEAADADGQKVMGMAASYLLDLKGYNPAASSKKFTVPMLIMQGDRDYQVTTKDFDLWKAGLAGRKDVTFKSYPALNHIFVAGEGKSTDAEYRKPGHVAPEVVDDIAKWIGQ